METLRGVGIIGCGDGGMSNYHGLVAAGIRTVAFYDNHEKVRNVLEFEGWRGVRICKAEAELLAHPDVDVVVIATPDGEHLAPARRVLEAGKYVFIEKPLATSSMDIAAFRDLIRRYPKKMLFSEKYSFAYPVQAALGEWERERLGQFLTGSTSYMMTNCDRIMGDGKWRTESAYNPVAGGLSHNFMTALLFARARITRVWAVGQVLAYPELKKYGGYDTMHGVLEFDTGRQLMWSVCLAVTGQHGMYAHRTVAHALQFENGSLVYGPDSSGDRLVVSGLNLRFQREPDYGGDWSSYNAYLYKRMWLDILASLDNSQSLHTIEQGLNVAYACHAAYQSARRDGRWMMVNETELL
ncbi:MAG: Gfo/Idh/MocA family oxidoreductase [Candidatus Sungbacteria bacterium]|nr:Gfo/Idh/MocA family oxidoreductase [Candidatus Sungbacteria bacterium]